MPGRSSSAASGYSGGSATRTASRSGSTALPSPVPPAPTSRRRRRPSESLDILRAVGDRRTFGKALWSVAEINADLGDAETAAAQFEEALTLFVEFGDRWFCGIVLESAAFLAAAIGDAERAVRLLGAADAVLGGDRGTAARAGFASGTTRVLAEARSRAGRGPLRSGLGGRYADSRSARRSSSSPRRAASPGVDVPEGLTTREVEVLALVAEGLTDAEVAERLVVSIRTVHAHLRSIYRKLDVHTRSAATRYALEHRLVA